MLKRLQKRLCLSVYSLSVFMLALVGVTTQAQAQGSYCTPVYGQGTAFGDYIGGVQLTGQTGAINVTSTGGPDYVYNTSVTTTLLAGAAYTLTLSPGTNLTGNNFAAWIDYNENYLFDQSEQLGAITVAGQYPANGSLAFTVPSGTTGGTKRLRIRAWNASTPGSGDPCGPYVYGQTHDYDLTVVPAIPCAGMPAAGTLPATLNACVPNPLTPASLGATTGAGITYYWLASTDGGSYWYVQVMTDDAHHVLPVPISMVGALYRLAVECANSGEWAVSNNTTITGTAPPVTSSNAPLCVGQTLTLSASGAPGTTYSWWGPNGFTSTAQYPVIPNATFAHNGTYQVVATNNGCTSTPAVSGVMVSQGQMPTWVFSNQPVCPGNTLLLTASGGVAGQFSWTGPNGFSGSSNVVSIPNLQPANYGTYTVYSGNGLCSSVATIAVGAPEPPVAPANISVCPGADLMLWADSAFFSQSFSWTGPNGFSSTQPNPVIANADSTLNGLYSVFAVYNGCVSDPTVVQVTVSPLLTLNSTNNGPVNQGSTLVLSANGSNGSYQWTGPNGFSAFGYNPYIHNAAPVHSGDYTVTLSSAGCNTEIGITNVVVNPMNQINGQVFNDLNNNGSQDAGEGLLEQVLIELQPGNYYTYTDTNGNYTAFVSDGTYTVSVAGLWPNQTATPGSISVTVAGSNQVSGGHNFGIHSASVNNLAVTITEVWAASPGFTTYQRITYQNLGTTPMNGTVKYLPDAVLLPNINTSSGYTVSGDTLIWSFSNLMPGQVAYKYVYATVPVPTPLGTMFNSTAWVTPLAGDIDSTNNSYTLTQEVTGSWDPNDKAVQPAGQITPADIAAGQDLVYTIRFQNTGTAPAINVLVADTLSPNLDWSTFQMLSSSHNYNLTIHENGALEWHFPNIMLPDSNSNEPASHGDIQYRIKPKNTLVVGDVIENTAHIYFDFNEAVITNTTHTPVALPSAAPEAHNLNFLHVYPNPNNGQATLRFTAANPAETTVTLLNLLGQEVQRVVRQTQAGEVEIPVELQQQPAGIYLVRVMQNGTVYSGKVVRQ